MKIHLDTGAGKHLIRAYEVGHVQIDQTRYNHSVLVLPDSVQPWAPDSFAELTAVHLEKLASLKPEIVLLGTGSRLRFPATSWLARLMSMHIGIECMDTGAACRTYNLLMSEGRLVVAALLLRDPPS